MPLLLLLLLWQLLQQQLASLLQEQALWQLADALQLLRQLLPRCCSLCSAPQVH
jgi:hypothetical protein